MFNAIVIDKNEDGQTVELKQVDEASLPEGDVTIDVAFSTLNFKDGLAITDREPAMGLRGIPECRVEMTNLRIPADRLITPPDGIKRGFAGLMNAYNAQRVGAATVALGIARGAYETAREFLKEREQFGRPISANQGMQFSLAQMATELEAARLLVYNAARLREHNLPFAHQAAMAKLFASNVAERVASQALEVYGGYGFTKEYPAEKFYRDAKIGKIYEGTSFMQLQTIAKTLLR